MNATRGKKTVVLSCWYPMLAPGAQVPWEDVDIAFHIGRKRAHVYPCIEGRADWEGELAIAEGELVGYEAYVERQTQYGWEVEPREEYEGDARAVVDRLRHVRAHLDAMGKRFHLVMGKRPREHWCWVLYASDEYLTRDTLEAAARWLLLDQLGYKGPFRYQWRVPRKRDDMMVSPA